MSYDCWDSNPAIRNFMASKRMHSTVRLEEYYASRIFQMVNKMDRSQMVWQDPFDKGVKVGRAALRCIWKIKLFSYIINSYFILAVGKITVVN